MKIKVDVKKTETDNGNGALVNRNNTNRNLCDICNLWIPKSNTTLEGNINRED